MTDDNYIDDVLGRCEALKRSGLWPAEPIVRPRSWLENFAAQDKVVAATLLDRFEFYNEQLTNRLLVSSFNSLGDGLQKGPAAPDRGRLLAALSSAVFSPVEGERPNLTDSGPLFCRLARQKLGVPEDRVMSPALAIHHALNGGAVVFLDDFIGSGDQFLKTWRRKQPDAGGLSFHDVRSIPVSFDCLYIALVSTSRGLKRIHTELPNVAVSCAHVLDESATVLNIKISAAHPLNNFQGRLLDFLDKYECKLRPSEPYMANNKNFRKFGYNEAGLMFGFAHSVPDATIPLFWAPGEDGWTPLVQRK